MTVIDRRGTWLVALAAMAIGCESGNEILTPTPEPEYLGVDVGEVPHNSISAQVFVRAQLFDSAFVRFWRPGGPTHSSPAYGFDGDTVVRVPVLGLDTASTYAIEVNLVLGDSTAAVDTASFQSGTLPDWIPVVGTQGTDTTPGLLAISFADGPVIIDNTGKVVWYLYSPNGRLNSFQVHPDGRYTLMGHNDPLRYFQVLDDLGEEVDSLSCVGYTTRFHEILIRPDGSAWIMCDETRRMDLTAVGGVNPADVVATVVQRLAPDGSVLSEWTSFDYVAITDIPPNARTFSRVNLTHGNALALDPDGHLLLSLRSLNQVMQIDTTSGDVQWRLGGVRNEFTFVNDPKGVFEGQHGVRVSGPGLIQLLDNGSNAPSRFLRYLLNPETRTALLVTEFIDAPDTWSRVGGGTDAYSNGHGIVTFGEAGQVVEVDEVGNRAWELTGIDGHYVFRVQRITSLYAPERVAAGR